MTDKRFQWVFIKDNELELRDNGIVKRFNNERLEELLNELNDENEQLKQQVAFLEEFLKSGVQYEYYQKIYEENKQLKKDILRLMYTAEHLVNIKKLEEKWSIDYKQFVSDLINGDEHL